MLFFYIFVAILSSSFFRAGADQASALAALAGLKILRKPGDCESTAGYPQTFQCAQSKKCISVKQYGDGTCDCCTPSNPDDNSDEIPCQWSNDKCKSHPDSVYNMTFQCAKTKKCLSRLRDHMNGRCDCCDDVADGDCSKCQDHSDEQCFCDEWQEKFYCDGNCISIKLWTDGKKDCPYSCIEPDVKSECLSKKTRSADNLEFDMCAKLVAKRYPHFNCTSQRKCLPYELIRNGNKDCAEGEDEDIKMSPDCTSQQVDENCDENTKQCIMVSGSLPSCRCANANNGFRPCNKARLIFPK